MFVQTGTAVLGAAKQTAKGTLAANPMFAHGVQGGTVIDIAPSQAALEVTSGTRTRANVYRDSSVNGSGFTSPAYMKSLGLYLLAALGTDVVTGAGPYLHTFASGALPYLSMFLKGLDSTIEAVRDCKMDTLKLSWDGANPVVLDAKLLGTAFSYPTTFVPTTDETGSESFLVPVAGTFSYAVLGSTPVSARITKGELDISNSPAAIQSSAKVEADDVYEAIQDHSISLTVVPDNLTDFRTAITGSSSGTATAQTAPIGSFSIVFNENNGPGTLTVTASKCAFLCAFPDADPKGGAAELTLVGVPVGATPVVYALSNQQATY